MKTIEQFKDESWAWIRNYLTTNHSNNFSYLMNKPLTNTLHADEYFVYFSLAQVDQRFASISSQLRNQFKKDVHQPDEFARYLAEQYLNEGKVVQNQPLNLQELGENIESHFFTGLSSILSQSRQKQIPLLKGLLLFLVQQYHLHYASLVAIELLNLGEKEAGKEFIEFARLHQNADGSFGVLNPLKPNPFKSTTDHQQWLFTNTLYLAVFLELYTRR